ncbi:MAG TPA: MerR family transcriptional regulator [Solirubrobacteraceae bacterium]|nr:MerR family transcriptional regulator [Solirubrobacteraceae bacterium]
MNQDGLLKMAELSERSGVSPATIKHYLREGLLGGEEQIVKTSRNMAWYRPELVDRLKLIKRLQEEEYLPLKVIRERLDEDRLLDAAMRARRAEAGARVPRAELAERLPGEVLDKLAELGVLTPDADGTYDPEDVRIADAFVRFRAGGYDEDLGFTVYDTLRYQRALAPLVEEEVGVLLENLRGEERAAEIIASGAEPLRELIGAMHSKMLLAALQRRRDA